jgi:hypothetical protein
MIFMPVPRVVSDFRPAAFCYHKRRVDETFIFIQRASIAKLVGNIRQRATQNFIATPRLKEPMHGFVVRKALRQHAPLRAVTIWLRYYFDARVTMLP